MVRCRKKHKGKEKVVRARGECPHRVRTALCTACTAWAPFSLATPCVQHNEEVAETAPRIWASHGLRPHLERSSVPMLGLEPQDNWCVKRVPWAADDGIFADFDHPTAPSAGKDCACV